MVLKNTIQFNIDSLRDSVLISFIFCCLGRKVFLRTNAANCTEMNSSTWITIKNINQNNSQAKLTTQALLSAFWCNTSHHPSSWSSHHHGLNMLKFPLISPVCPHSWPLWVINLPFFPFKRRIYGSLGPSLAARATLSHSSHQRLTAVEPRLLPINQHRRSGSHPVTVSASSPLSWHLHISDPLRLRKS